MLEVPASMVDLTVHSLGTPRNATLDSSEIALAGALMKDSFRTRISFQSTFIVYMIALVSFVGWFLFAIFGGVGLAALPMDLITAFTTRPKPMPAEELAHEQLLLQARVADLIEVGNGETRGREKRERREEDRSSSWPV